MTGIRALVIGGGAAGLQAACILAEKGIGVDVLEARDRIGGRIHSIHPPELDVPLELGAEFVHGRPPSTWHWIHRAGLTAFDIPFNHLERRGGRLSEAVSYEDGLGRIMGGLSKLGAKDMSFRDYLRRFPAKQSSAVRRALEFVRGFDAADPDTVSARSLAEEHENAGAMDQTQYRLLQGYGAMAEYLRMSAQERGAQIHLNTAVGQIRWKAGAVSVRTRDGREFRAGRAIVALPAAVLSLPVGAPGAVSWDPIPPGLRENLGFIAPGPVIKVLLLFHEAFWENKSLARRTRFSKELADASFMHDPAAAIPVWWTALPLRVPLLTGWKGGPDAFTLSGRGEPAIRRVALQSLGHLLGMSPASLGRKLDTFYFHDWTADPYSREAYSYLKVGGADARAALGRPVQRTVYFAGEAVDTSGQASTVAGALASGSHAAGQLLAGL